MWTQVLTEVLIEFADAIKQKEESEKKSIVLIQWLTRKNDAQLFRLWLSKNNSLKGTPIRSKATMDAIFTAPLLGKLIR